MDVVLAPGFTCTFIRKCPLQVGIGTKAPVSSEEVAALRVALPTAADPPALFDAMFDDGSDPCFFLAMRRMVAFIHSPKEFQSALNSIQEFDSPPQCLQRFFPFSTKNQNTKNDGGLAIRNQERK